jgi:transposase
VPDAAAAAPQERPGRDAGMAGTRPPLVQNARYEHPGQAVEVWFQDEARIGQQGTLTHVWASRGSRPTAVKQTEYEWGYLFASVNSRTGEATVLVSPTVNTHYMNAHLTHIAMQVGPQRHVVLVLDQAGWHVAKDLQVPSNITLFHVPSYSPELNAAERPWAYLRQHYLSNRVYKDYQELFAVVSQAWNRLSEDTLMSLCAVGWVERMN